MPQVTNLISKLVPGIKAEFLLDIGIGDGETITTILPHFGNPVLYGCDPVDLPSLGVNYWIEKAPYHESTFYEKDFDVITLLDSLPCYHKDKGEQILDHAVEKSRKLTLVWCPDGYYPYPPFQSCWHPEDFLKRGFSLYRATNIHQGPPMVASGLLAWRI